MFQQINFTRGSGDDSNNDSGDIESTGDPLAKSSPKKEGRLQ